METVIRFDDKTGIFFDKGIFLVVGYTQSKEFKTLEGANSWAKKIGIGE
jgi:hypothetical protein